MYKMNAGSVRGCRHIKENMPCEDSVLTAGCAFAVADGHSDSNCFRAAVGSKLACKVACEALSSFPFTKEIAQKLRGEEKDALLRHITLNLLYGWKEAVQAHLEAHPFTEEELSGVPDAELHRQNRFTEHAYGTTLIAGVFSEDAQQLILLQAGDGVTVLYDRDGKPSQALALDERCRGNISTSLCEMNPAAVRCGVFELGNLGGFAIATDGVEGSRSETFAFLPSLIGLSPADTAAALDTRSRAVSHDDASAVVVTLSGYEKVIRQAAEREKDRLSLKSEISYLKNKINSIENGGKLKSLERTLNSFEKPLTLAEIFSGIIKNAAPESNRQAKKQLAAAMRETYKLFAKEKKAREEYDSLKAEYDEYSGEYLDLRNALEQAQSEYKRKYEEG